MKPGKPRTPPISRPLSPYTAPTHGVLDEVVCNIATRTGQQLGEVAAQVLTWLGRRETGGFSEAEAQQAIVSATAQGDGRHVAATIAGLIATTTRRAVAS